MSFLGIFPDRKAEAQRAVYDTYALAQDAIDALPQHMRNQLLRNTLKQIRNADHAEQLGNLSYRHADELRRQ